MGKPSKEELEQETAILENINRDFSNLGKNLLEPLQEAKGGHGMRSYGGIYKIAYQWLNENAFGIYFNPLKEFQKSLPLTFKAGITKAKINKDKINLVVKCSFSNNKIGYTGRFKIKSKNLKYKIDLTGYRKNRLDKVKKELLAWVLQSLKKMSY